MDNADVRFADQDTKGKRPVTYGLTINNNPTVQDVWNSTPVWGYPYASSSVAPAPMATAQIDGNLGQQVTGLTAYTLWNNMVYGEFGFYRSSQIGGVQPPDTSSENVLKGGAPYWRIAVQHNWGLHYLELGTYGIVANMYPGAGNPLSGSTNRYTDGALDAQYQIQMGQHTITAHSTWIWERQRLRAAYALMEAANPTDILRTFKIDGTYYNNRRYGGTLAFFTTGGSEDAGLYAPNPIDGSRTGKPDSTGWIAEMDYVPWSNTKLSLQYTMYTRFNGAGENYDGYGRAASDNNNLYLNVWLMY